MDKLPQKNIINRIYQLAQQQGITIAFLCRAVGKDRSFITCVKNGRNTIDARELAIIADKLGTTPAYLMGETDDPQASDRPQPSELDLQILQKLELLSAEDRLRAEQFIDFMLAQHNR